LTEAQWLAEFLIDAEVKIGELISRIPPQEHGDKGQFTNKLPEGLSHKQSHYFQKMAKNVDIVEEVKAGAKGGKVSKGGGRKPKFLDIETF